MTDDKHKAFMDELDALLNKYDFGIEIGTKPFLEFVPRKKAEVKAE